MKYVVLLNGKVFNTFPEIDPIRPTLRPDQLYTPDFLANCILVQDELQVNPGDVYDSETSTFSAPVPETELPVDPPLTETETMAAYTEGVNSLDK